MKPAQTQLVERLRALLEGGPAYREVSMFGVRSFMVEGALAVSAGGDGGLLVRVATDRHDELLERPGAEQARMGKERKDMGPGWLDVAADAIATDEALAWWLQVALDRTGTSAPAVDIALRSTSQRE